jgi:hypothetical protein
MHHQAPPRRPPGVTAGASLALFAYFFIIVLLNS